jgi:hypothetical protein
VPTFCFTAEEGAALEDGSWIVAEMTNDEANVSTALRALKSSDYRVRAAACLALKTLALTLAPSQQQGKAEMVTGRLTSMPLLSRGHIKVVPVMAGLLVKDDDPYVRMCAAEALGTIAAPGDALALDACQRAIKDRAWMVAEAATTALAKLVNKGEQTVTLMAERELASRKTREAAATQETLMGTLTRLIKDNIDCEIARLRTFDLCWLVDLSTGLCHSWPLEKFSPPPKSSVTGGSSLSRASSVVSSSAASAASGQTGVTGSSGGSSTSSYLTPEKLAWAGFYYAPTAEKEDKCVCFICGASRYDWFSTDDPILFHLPTCVFKQQAYSDPEILLA